MFGHFVDYFLELYHWGFVTSWKKTGELFAINKGLAFLSRRSILSIAS